MTIDIVLIAGPTASGKSAAALAIAEACPPCCNGGVIINADSMQVYRELSILTARPSADDLARAPHRLYGTVSAHETFSVAQWADAAIAAINDARALGKLPIVVGGTGLYFHVLAHGLSPVPAIDVAVREKARALREELGAMRFHAELAALDPEMAQRLNPNDSQRMIRAYEVARGTGTKLSQWQKTKGTPLIDSARALRIVMAPERDDLATRIDQRFDAMMADGALDEARAFSALEPSPSWPAVRALGLRPLMRHLAGEISREVAIDISRRQTRAYAKRQMTWFRHQMADWQHLTLSAAQGSAAQGSAAQGLAAQGLAAQGLAAQGLVPGGLVPGEAAAAILGILSRLRNET